MDASPQFGKWLPIESAPKDGTEILVWWPRVLFYVHSGMATVAWGEAEYWELVHCGEMATSARLGGEPTLWTPLPEAPKEEKA